MNKIIKNGLLGIAFGAGALSSCVAANLSNQYMENTDLKADPNLPLFKCVRDASPKGSSTASDVIRWINNADNVKKAVAVALFDLPDAAWNRILQIGRDDYHLEINGNTVEEKIYSAFDVIHNIGVVDGSVVVYGKDSPDLNITRKRVIDDANKWLRDVICTAAFKACGCEGKIDISELDPANFVATYFGENAATVGRIVSPEFVNDNIDALKDTNLGKIFSKIEEEEREEKARILHSRHEDLLRYCQSRLTAAAGELVRAGADSYSLKRFVDSFKKGLSSVNSPRDVDALIDRLTREIL